MGSNVELKQLIQVFVTNNKITSSLDEHYAHVYDKFAGGAAENFLRTLGNKKLLIFDQIWNKAFSSKW